MGSCAGKIQVVYYPVTAALRALGLGFEGYALAWGVLGVFTCLSFAVLGFRGPTIFLLQGSWFAIRSLRWRPHDDPTTLVWS